jgi:hypothetical protein
MRDEKGDITINQWNPEDLIQCSTGLPSQSSKARERNKRDSNRKGRNHIIPIFRWYDPIHKRP